MVRPARPTSPAAAVAEVFVVVIGVLIALLAESWWADRDEARVELEYLTQLESDVVALLAEIDESVGEERRILEQLQTAATALIQGDPDAPFGVSFTTSVPTLRNGGLAQVEAMRGPRLADDPALRALIGNLAASVSSTDRVLASFFDDVLDNLRVALLEVARVQTESGEIPTNGALRDIPEVRTAVTFHGVALTNRIATLEQLRVDAEALRDRLRATLEEAGVPPPTASETAPDSLATDSMAADTPSGEPTPVDSVAGVSR